MRPGFRARDLCDLSAPVPAHIGHQRLQEHAEGEGHDRAVADDEAGHRTADHPPRIGKPDRHSVLPRCGRAFAPGIYAILVPRSQPISAISGFRNTPKVKAMTGPLQTMRPVTAPPTTHQGLVNLIATASSPDAAGLSRPGFM